MYLCCPVIIISPPPSVSCVAPVSVDKKATHTQITPVVLGGGTAAGVVIVRRLKLYKRVCMSRLEVSSIWELEWCEYTRN